MKLAIAAFAIIFYFNSCGPPQTTNNYLKTSRQYKQNFTAREALFVRERNGMPFVMASAFLIDKQKGRFASAKHFVGSESDGQCRIFFNGRVYDGFLLKLPPITDLAVFQISGYFDPTSFPEPYKIAKQIRAGNKIFIRGIHPHPLAFQKNKIILPIYRDYYGLSFMNGEFVYDSLEGKVIKLDVPLKNKNIGGFSGALAEFSNLYTKLKTQEEHRLTPTRGFAGLSGGPTVNEKEELVGVNSNEERGGLELRKEGVVYKPWDTLYLVPVSELEELMPQLQNIK